MFENAFAAIFPGVRAAPRHCLHFFFLYHVNSFCVAD